MMRYLVLSILLLLLSGVVISQTSRVTVLLDGSDCYGSELFLLATPTNGAEQFVYEWRKKGVIHDRTVSDEQFYQIRSLAVTDTGRYYCVVTDMTGVKFVTDQLVIRGGNLNVRLPQLQSVAQKESLTLTAVDEAGVSLAGSRVSWLMTGGSGWSWNQDDGNPKIFKVGAGDAMIRATYTEDGCRGSDSTYVVVRPIQFFRSAEHDGFARVSLAFRVTVDVPKVFCDNETLTFTASAKGDAGTTGYTYSWYKKEGSHAAFLGDGELFELRNARPENAGYYYCSVRDINGFTVVSDTMALAYQPIVVRLPELLYATQGDKLNVIATDTSLVEMKADSIKWFLDKGDGRWTAGGSTPVNPYIFTAADRDMRVKVLFTNWKNCTAQDSLPVFVRSSKMFSGGADDGFAMGGASFIVTVEEPLQREFCENDLVSMKAMVEGKTEGYKFSWWKVASPADVMVGEEAEYVISRTLMSDAGYYYCQARDANGFVAKSDTVRLTSRKVVLPEVMYATANDDVYVSVLDGKGDTIRDAVTWMKKSLSGYSWSPVGSTSNPVKVATGTSDMVVKATYDFGGCTATDTMLLYVKSASFAGNIGDGFARTMIPPVITVNLTPNMLCTTADSVSMHIVAMGSDLRYQWQILNKSTGSFEQLALAGAEGADARDLILRGLRAGLSGEFNGVFRCRVSNGEGIEGRDSVVYSDTLTLYANHQLSVSLERDTVTLYNGQKDTIGITLEHGVKPWSYVYQTPFGENMGRDKLSYAHDSIPVYLAGRYQLVSLSDSLGCKVTENLPYIYVTTPEIPKIQVERLSEERICSGGDVYLCFKVRDGVGPWKVWLNNNGVLAGDLGIEWPIVMHGRDTTIGFTTNNSGSYTVGKLVDMNHGGGEWQGLIEGGAATVTVVEGDIVRFAILADNHVGNCNSVDFFKMLKPSAAGKYLSTGTFKVDGLAVGSIWGSGQMSAGSHDISYLYTNPNGCVSNTSVILVVDPRPVASIVLPGDVCVGEEVEMRVNTTGYGVGFLLQNNRTNSKGSVTVSEIRVTLPTTENVYKMNVGMLPEDLAQSFFLKDLKDQHGCTGTVNGNGSVVNNRHKPTVELENRYPNTSGVAWASGKDTIWTWGDACGVRATLGNGVAPWSFKLQRSEKGSVVTTEELYVSGSNYVLSLGQTGDYSVYVSDSYCTNEAPVSFAVRHQKPAYLRLKLLMEELTASEGIMITVELRRANSAVEAANGGEVVARDLCRVLPNGSVLDKEGNSVIRLQEYGIRGEVENLYVVVSHPAYLSVMSAKACPIADNPAGAVFIDFTKSNNVYVDGSDITKHMTNMGEVDGRTVWALSTIDMNNNGLISVRDYNEVEAMSKGRLVEQNDLLDLTQKNRHKYSDVK